jgi:hypothetical protein
VARDHKDAVSVLAEQYFDNNGDAAIQAEVQKWIDAGMQINTSRPQWHNVSYGNAAVQEPESADARRTGLKDGGVFVCRDFPENGPASAVAIVVAKDEADASEMARAYVESRTDSVDYRRPEMVQQCGQYGSLERVDISKRGFVLLSDGAISDLI